MSFELRARGTIDRLVNHFGNGSTITLRRNVKLMNGLTGKAATGLAINGTVAAGQSAVTIDAPNLEEGGVLPAGVTFTISGDATVYTTAADVRVDSSGDLVDVSFTPVLAAEATDDAAVTLTATYADYDFPFARMDILNEETAEFSDRTMYRFIVSVSGAEVEWATELDAALVEGNALNVVRVKPYEPGTVLAGLILEVAV